MCLTLGDSPEVAHKKMLEPCPHMQSCFPGCSLEAVSQDPSGPFWILLSPGVADPWPGPQGQVLIPVLHGVTLPVLYLAPCDPAAQRAGRSARKSLPHLAFLLGKFWAAPYHQVGWLPARPPSIFLPEGAPPSWGQSSAGVGIHTSLQIS